MTTFFSVDETKSKQIFLNALAARMPCIVRSNVRDSRGKSWVIDKFAKNLEMRVSVSVIIS